MIQVVAGVLIRDQTLLVAARPSHKPYAGYWELPGGKVEQQESSFHALQRELAEEIGIQVINAQILFHHIHHYPEKTVGLAIWRVYLFEGEPRPLEEQEIAWVTWKELQHLRVLEGNKEFLSQLKPHLS